MQRAHLKKLGEPILTVLEPDGSAFLDYCFVSCASNLVGVAIFHHGHAVCTVALVRDEDGHKVMLSHLDEDYPVEPMQLKALEEIYARNFTY
ncbi:hypothetical protein PQ465_07235 [Sphingobacterium oryzagri]|uniref:Uncharacterized protein n=1 Tax=Sphingobacterium oryzagri TaxID=3025669 RepID=A0ABY7WLX0_9SPHI|nr:hypothetical protein [Sphingobacterium sp. KACC 22765]WDF70163.1 hypothetical protein PQ465_07235 [Sphingobacterium sp. KACC 22765]